MKRLIILIVMLCGVLPFLQANKGCDQQLTKEEFRARQRAFITEKAELTQEESKRFFPLYFQLQGRKKALNDKVWKLYRQGKDTNTTEEQYEKILEEIFDLRLAERKLDKEYFERFQEVLSNKKIYLIQRAEMKFNRQLLKEVKQKPASQHKSKPQK